MVAAGRRPTDRRLAPLLGPLGPVAGPVLDLPALPVPDAAELLVEDEVLAARLDLLPRRAAVGDVGADLDEGGEPELGLRPEAVGGVGALAEHVAHGLRLGVLVGEETSVAAVEAAGGVVAQLRGEIMNVYTWDCSASSFFSSKEKSVCHLRKRSTSRWPSSWPC